MKKSIGIFATIMFMASTTQVVAKGNFEKKESAPFFCDAGWEDVIDYFDNAGEDGFYAGYLFCYHCGC